MNKPGTPTPSRAARAALAPLDEDIESIIARVRAGEVDQFALIVRRYQHEIWKLLVHVLRDSAAAEPLVQQCFVDVFRHLDSYQPGRDFASWLRGTARHLALAELRRARREARRLARYHDYVAALNEGTLDGSGVADLRLAELVRRCREQLPVDARRAIEMRYYRAMKLPQIAVAIGRTVPGTRQLLYRARRLLKACIEARRAEA